MKLDVLGSGSNGNCYALTNDNNEVLLLDLGLSEMDIKKGLNFKISNIVGAIVSHSHSDHSRSAERFKKMGIKVWQPYLNEESIETMQFGLYKIISMPVPHDNTSNRAFLIECDREKILYATDLEYLPFSMVKRRINHLLIECNYIDDLVDDEAENLTHVIKGHCELGTTIGIVKTNKTSSLRTVICCHLSDKNADKYRILKEIKEVAGCDTYIAEKGLSLDLSLPF